MPESLDRLVNRAHTPRMRKWLPLITVSLGTFMLLIDVTIVNVALPDMATDLHSSFSSLQWVIDIYALALAALLLGIGAYSDKVGRRPVYIVGLVVFALSSLSCGLAPSTPVLIVSRGVQGIGAAAMFATTIALLSTSYEGRDRGLAFGVWGAINGAAAAAGPILGGLLTEGLSWRWIFFVNLPISVVAVALAVYALSADEPRREGRVDLPGMVAFTVSAAAVTYALTRASDAGWGSAQTIGLLALSVVALLAFVVIETRSRRPLLDLALLRRPRFSAVLVAAFILSLAAFSYLTYISLWLQSVRGMSPIGAGAAFLPLSLASLVVSLAVGRFLHTPTAQRWALTGGLTLIGAGALLAAHLGAGSDWTSVLIGLLVNGIGVGLVAPTLASAALGAVPPQLGGMASGALNTMRQLGYALGIAGLGVVLQSRIGDSLSGAPHVADSGRLAKAVAGGQSRAVLDSAPPAARAGLDQAIHAAFASGLNATLVICGVAGLIGAVIVAVALRPAASEAESERPAPERPAGSRPPRAAPAERQRSAAGQTSR
jgi:EmrB/QacA subfamily drug resistance transporter